MRQFLSALLLGALILALVAGVVLFGAVTLEYAAPLYGLAVLMSLLWAARLLFDRTFTWPSSPVYLPVAAFFVYGLIRYWTSPLEYESRLELLHLCLYCFFFFLVTSNFNRSRDRTALVITLTCLAFAESVYGLWQFITHAETCLYLRRPDSYFHRAGGTFMCPNHLAGFLEIVLAVLLARTAILRPPKTSLQGMALQKMVLAYAGLVILAGLVATLSRAAWISLTIGFLTFLLLRGWRTKTIWPRVLIGAAGVIIVLIVASQIGPVRDYIEISLTRQASAPKLLNDASLGTRMAMWLSSVNIIANHPLIGTGPGTWQWFHPLYRDPSMQMHPIYAHNDYLNFAADYGLIGLALLIVIVVAFFRHVSRFLHADTPSEQRSFGMGVLVAVVVLLVHSTFDFNLHIPANALLLVTLAGFTVAMDQSSDRARAGMKLWLRLLLALVLVGFAGGLAWVGGHMFLAHQHITRGTEAKDTVDFKQAVDHFQEAVRLDPKNPAPYARLGDIYSTYATLPHRPEQESDREVMLNYAVEVYTKSFELNRYQSDVLVRLANAYHKNGDIESALRAFQEALAVDPNNAATFFHLGGFYLELGEKTKARAAFQKSRDLNYWTDPASLIQLEEIKPTP